jgi:hypothetical protein
MVHRNGGEISQAFCSLERRHWLKNDPVNKGEDDGKRFSNPHPRVVIEIYGEGSSQPGLST